MPVRLSAWHRKIIRYAVPGKEPFYEAFGFRRMTTAMAIFEDPAKACRSGYLEQAWPIVPAHHGGLHAPVGLSGLRPLAAYCSKTVHPSVAESA